MVLPNAVRVLPETALVRSLMTTLRNRSTPTDVFRPTAITLARLVVAAAVEEEPVEEFDIKTPLESAIGYRFRRGRAAVVPILRAGGAFEGPFCETLPNPRFLHLGLIRDHATLQPKEYKSSIPRRIGPGLRTIYVADPMFATGGSALYAVDMLKKRGARKVVYVGLVGVPEAIDLMRGSHPDVPIYLGSLETGLNERGYIRGNAIGDFGKRYYNSFS